MVGAWSRGWHRDARASSPRCYLGRRPARWRPRRTPRRAVLGILNRTIGLRSYHALDPRSQRLWRAVRLLVPHRNRFLFEGCRLLPGQLWYADRALLFDSVRRYRPRFVFEVGTWKGGGSTLFIAQALFENGTGILHTIDVDPQLHAEATEGYRRHVPHLLPHVRFHLGASTEV